MATPTLVIGLGGTGLKAATFIKKNLMESNQNQMPRETAIMVLDTEKKIKFSAGGWGQARDTEHATGPVKIDIGEYVAMTGNARATGEEIKREQSVSRSNPGARRNQPYRHMSSWFQATYYLDEANVPEQVWNLDEGAGRYRQFGRLALFSNIDMVEQKLKSAIQAIQRVSQNQTLYVHVVGSLAGGTGAALFSDVAHLVQIICKDAGYNQAPVILGHFVLTEAFRGTRNVKLNDSGVLQNFNARMYAGLRELTRLQSAIIRRSGGYPMVYDPNGTGTRNSKLMGKPYDAVYLYDGVGERIQLNQQLIEGGLAPAIADIISAYIDEMSGGAFRSHSVNYNAFYNAYNIPTGAVTYGSVGAYTIELPIYHITEGWAHRLAGEVLDALLAPAPTSIDEDTGVPSRLVANNPGGRTMDPESEAKSWLRNNTTALVGKIADWGRRAGQTEQIGRQVSGEILALSAEGWQVELAPSDPRFANYVVEAQTELKGSLADKKSDKYYIDHGQLSGGSNTEKALSLQDEVDGRLRQMVGNVTEIWKREGGDFRKALARLGNHHVMEFENNLLKFVRDTLNGTEVGDAEQRKGGKLGYVLAFLSALEADLANGAQVLALADRQSQPQRRPIFDGIESKRNAAFTKLQRGAGLLGGNAREYRDSSDELAQFHKADIARQVAFDLAKRLHKAVGQLLEEARLWERVLATSIADYGGAYALIRRGRNEVESDRRASQNAARWVIADDEKGDSYISDKYAVYSKENSDSNDSKRAEILDKVVWKVGKMDGRGDIRIEFTLEGGQPWSREAGQKDAMLAGQRNISRLLALCREPFEQAWADMSVTAWLYQNYYEHGSKLDGLAEKIYKSCDYLLDLEATKKTPTMRTAFVRVYQDRLDNRGESFLRDLRIAVDKQFGTTTTADQREQITAGAGGKEGEPGPQKLSETGEPSTDPFKITFLIYGDLLLPSDVQAFSDGRKAYQQFSGSGEQWQELQILPADTNALQIERGLDSSDQKRREFDPDVVTVMEDMGNFQTAMRCFAFGETDYFWDIAGKTGLLLHKHTPLENNPSGHSYWRLMLMPEGTLGADGKTVYDQFGGLAQPLEYKLSPLASEPSLLEAFIQLISRQADYDTDAPIDWIRVEDTLQKVMVMHRDQWASAEAMNYRLQPGKDARLQGELKDKAAQLVRLNALVAAIDEELGKDTWAWSRSGGNVPPRIAGDPSEKAKIQKAVDMWTAIRGSAREEILNLNKRLNQIGVRFDVTPTERLTISSPHSADEQETQASDGELPPGTWFCPDDDSANSPDSRFCTSCGRERPDDVRMIEAPPVDPGQAPDVPVATEPATTPVAPLPTRITPVVAEPVQGPVGVAPVPAASTAAIECVNGHEMQPGWKVCPICREPPKPQQVLECVNGHEMQPGWVFCPICGGVPKPQVLRCVNGHEMQLGWAFCTECGAGPATA